MDKFVHMRSRSGRSRWPDRLTARLLTSDAAVTSACSMSVIPKPIEQVDCRPLDPKLERLSGPVVTCDRSGSIQPTRSRRTPRTISHRYVSACGTAKMLLMPFRSSCKQYSWYTPSRKVLDLRPHRALPCKRKCPVVFTRSLLMPTSGSCMSSVPGESALARPWSSRAGRSS